MILKTTEKANLNGAPVKGFPLVIDDAGKVEWLVLEYCLDLMRSTSVSSIRLYASHLTDFLSQLEVDEISLGDVNDDWLEAYKTSILGRKNASGQPNSLNYATQILRSVIHYLYWLETNGYLRHVVGETKLHKVRIELKKKGVSHPLSQDTSSGRKLTITPRKDWIESIKPYGPQREDLAIRFELMLEWGVGLGLRAMEICALRVDQLPSRETARKAYEEAKNVFFKLTKTKGGKPSTVPVSPLLVMRTWDYIDQYRGDIIRDAEKRHKRRYKVYQQPSEIFLSGKTGEVLTPRGFSNAVRKAFLSAVEAKALTIDERVWVHGLRHNFTANLLRGFDAKGVARPEAVARQVTRHGHVDSMEPYLTDRFNEDFDG